MSIALLGAQTHRTTADDARAQALQHVEIAEGRTAIAPSTGCRDDRQITFDFCREDLPEKSESTETFAIEAEVPAQLSDRRQSRGIEQIVETVGERQVVGPATPLARLSDRVRSTDGSMLQLLREGGNRSTTFRGLLDIIGQSTAIVYVEFGYCAFGHLNGCLLPFLTSSHGDRYLRVLVTPDTRRRSHDQLIALVAHELRHVVEVIQHQEVVDADSMEAMYRKIGIPLAGNSRAYETSAARAAGDAVLLELLAKAAAR
jgi:hypothetical protein